MSEERYLTSSDLELISELVGDDIDRKHGQHILDMVAAKGSRANADPLLEVLRLARQARAQEADNQ
jgi:hypothetical protein